MNRFNSHSESSAREEIQREIHHLLSAMDELKHSASKESRQGIEQLKSRAERLWDRTREHWGEADFTRRPRELGRYASEYAHEHPWTTLAFGLGVVAGATLLTMLLYRR